MKCVILCGGKGTRLREQTEYLPKSLIEIGERPILWHIMQIFSILKDRQCGIVRDQIMPPEFVLALGYKGNTIKHYCHDYNWIYRDNVVFRADGSMAYPFDLYTWKIWCVETGLETLTNLRLQKLYDILKYEENFFLTYGDGVADINVNDLLQFHIEQQSILTITGVHPHSKYGMLEMGHDKFGDLIKIVKMNEKGIMNDWINGGFMVCNKKIWEYIKEEDLMLETSLFPRLIEKGLVNVWKHTGYWHGMDTMKDWEELNADWAKNQPWKVW